MTKNILGQKSAASRVDHEIELRHPLATDGLALHRMVAESPPLDNNSLYCNLLQCLHFCETSVAACCDGRLVGFVSGYLLPGDPATLFIWQVVVAAAGRKRGLARRMLRELLSRQACRQVRFVHTTITPDNVASCALFSSFAREMGAPIGSKTLFERSRHFGGEHDDEILLEIGPFNESATR